VAKKLALPVKRSPRSDPQQYRFYRMENEALLGPRYVTLPRKTIRKLASAVCRRYRVKQVPVIFRDLGDWYGSTHRSGYPRIEINSKKKSARCALVILHELAHWVHDHLAPDNKHQAHGKEYLCVYASVFDSCRIIPLEAMRVVFAKYRLSFLDPGTSPSPSKLRQLLSQAPA
jgi:hypothetical protein